MTEREIIKLVLEMRKAQSRFFRTRTTADLDNARNLERQVDKELKNYFNPNNQCSIDFSSSS